MDVTRKTNVHRQLRLEEDDVTILTTTTRVPDEELKSRMHGGADHDRSNGAYPFCPQDAEALQRTLAANFLTPTDEDIEAAAEDLQADAAANGLVMSVPMKENGPTIQPMLGTVTTLMAPNRITVINNFSDDDALNAVRRFKGVNLLWADDMLKAIRWNLLLPILNLASPPKGKGVAMLAGYLFEYVKALLTGKTPGWVCQHDAEIAEYARYRALLYLLWGLKQRSDAHYVKIAKFGRGNETCMAARSSLSVLASLLDRLIGPGVPAADRARDMFNKLLQHKWMLTGEFMLSWELAMHRFFATGYLEETLCSICAEDIGARDGYSTIHVANPNPRLDEKNDPRKEAIMQQQISNFIFRMVGEVPTIEWTLETMVKINHHWMADAIVMGWIDHNDNPVVAESTPNDRIIPSIAMLIEHDFVDLEAAKRVVESFLQKGTGSTNAFDI